MPRSREVINDRFTIEQLAGFGGMGQVYRARDRVSGGPVALKVMHDAEQLEIERFAREAQVLSTLSHPGIVRYIDSGITAEGEPYLAMEWLSGETLATRLQRTQLTLAEAFALGRRVASALDAIHRRGVVHRDIKPSNLFLRGSAIDKVALIDFGMARRPLADPKLTVTGTMLGTPGYIAPEQVYNVPNLDGRADIFSLGCVLYRCLSGRAPFRGPDALRMLLNGTPAMLPRLREHRPSIPAELDDLVARMLSRAPEDRPPTGDVVAAELLAIEEKEPSPAVTGSGPRRVVSEILATERRLMCLVLARLLVRAEPTCPAADREAQERALYEVVERHRGKLEILADGSLLVILSNADAATDLAARAARCALALQGLLGTGAVIVVSGREVLGPGLHASELLDRAVDLLETTAKWTTIRIDELTSALLKNRFDTGRTGRHLRGELREHNPMRLVFGEPVPCVGREQELEQLETIFDQCAEEHAATMVLLSGPDGVGKSRLGHEFLGKLAGRGRAVEIWLGEADPLNAGPAFSLLGQVLRRALRLVDDEPIEARRDKIRAWVQRHPGAGGRRLTEVLGTLVGTPFETDDNPELASGRTDPRLPSEEMGQAFLSVLREACAAQPVVIVLEDLHWGDLPTIKLIYAALGVFSDRPLLVLALARTNIHELFPQLWADRCVQEIRLGKLSRKASVQLVGDVLGDAVADDAIKTLVKRSDRHASYLGELIRAAAGGKGATTPQTVLAMVQARIEKLDPAARRVLRAASVFGETFWRGGVEALLGDGDTAAWLAVLAEQGVVEVRDGGRYPGEVEHRFQHALVREAAYEMLTTDDRVTGNWLAARWLEQVGETDPKIIEAYYERCETGGHARRARDGSSAGAPRRSAARLARGQLLGDRFEIEEPISSGGMPEVARARDRVSGDVVAVKLVSEVRDGLAARLALVSELAHPGIVRHVSHGTTSSGERFVVVEWLDGEDLETRLGRAALTLTEAVTLAARVAEALGAAHARGIVHGDLQPSNLFLPGRHLDQVKVLGLATAPGAGRTRPSPTGTTIRVPGYLAPEQARDRGAAGARADVFALGCVVFQCLTRTPAFEGATATATLGKILFGEAPRVSALWPEVPEGLDALVARMLANDPALRPGDGAAVAAALAALEPQVRSAAVAPKPGTGKHLALAGSERRFVSVVVLGGPSEGDAVEPALRRVIEPYGGKVEVLTDGSMIVMLEVDRQVATDHAAQVARCALAMSALAGGRLIAIAMGRAETTRKLPEEDVIDRASRLLAHMARPSPDRPAIALDEVSAGLLDARFDVSDDDAGLMLHGERVLMQGARTLLGRPTSCVGRDWELGALTAILDDCIDKAKARAVVVTAAAGIGKSRVAAELVSRVQQRTEPVAIWVGRGDSLRAGSTLDLLAQALRGALGIHGGEPLADRRDRLAARVAEHVPAGDHKRVTEFLGELVGTPLPGDDDGGAALRAARQDAQLMSEQMRKAWLDFLDAETCAQPVLIVLEDLHWGDLGTVRFIETALRERPERPWMVLALARPEVYEEFPRMWAELQNVEEIRLQELGRKAGERLARQVLGDSVGAELVERLVERAHGNVFYLEELIRAAAEAEDKAKDKDTAGGKDHALPETVLAMVAARLGRLPVDARRVLRAASVFGEVCWEGGAGVLLDGAMAAATVSEWLARLVEQEVLAVRPDSRFPGERELAFRHSLLREGVYATLTEDDIRLGHRLAGDWLARHGEADPMVLAGHFERGGEGARAASYYLRAAEQAYLHVLDIDAIMALASRGLGCAPPEDLRLALLGMRCQASGGSLHTIDAAMPDAEELMRAAPRGSVPWAQGVMAYLEGTTLAGRIPDFLSSVALLRDVDPAPEAVGRMSLALLAAVCILDVLGRLPEATALEQRFSAMIDATGDREPIARFWRNVAAGMRAAYAHEDPWDGLAHSTAIQPIFDAIGGRLIFVNMELFRAINLWFLGALAPAEQKLQDLAAADESLGVASSLRRFCLSWLRADRGELDEARVLATQLSEAGHAHRNPLDEGRGRWVLAEVLRRAGDLDGADRELTAALGMAMPFEYPGVLGTLSALRLAQGRAGEALAAAEDAVARCAAMGGCGMFRGAFVRLVHAEALHATGAHDAARHAIAGARTRLFAIADRIADRQYRTSFLERVPENARTLALAGAWLGASE